MVGAVDAPFSGKVAMPRLDDRPLSAVTKRKGPTDYAVDPSSVALLAARH